MAMQVTGVQSCSALLTSEEMAPNF